jgi:GNAT superfamily N-acetyltransferase
MSVELEITDSPLQEHLALLERRFREFMSPVGSRSEMDRPLAIFAKNADGSVIAGMSGKTGWDQLFVNLLYVDDDERRRGLGTKLMQLAETEARARGCHSAWLMTSNPDAKVFYEKLGYRTFGAVERHPPSSARYFLTKVL